MLNSKQSNKKLFQFFYINTICPYFSNFVLCKIVCSPTRNNYQLFLQSFTFLTYYENSKTKKKIFLFLFFRRLTKHHLSSCTYLHNHICFIIDTIIFHTSRINRFKMLFSMYMSVKLQLNRFITYIRTLSTKYSTKNPQRLKAPQKYSP